MMTRDQAEYTGAWASLLLRLAVAALFFSGAVGKLKNGMDSVRQTVSYFQLAFSESWLPKGLVTLHGYVTPFAEALIVLWLILGFRLRAAWMFTGLFLITLAFGMSVIGKHDVAAHNYNYVLISAVGLYLSRWDRWNVDALNSRRGKS